MTSVYWLGWSNEHNLFQDRARNSKCLYLKSLFSIRNNSTPPSAQPPSIGVCKHACISKYSCIKVPLYFKVSYHHFYPGVALFWKSTQSSFCSKLNLMRWDNEIWEVKHHGLRGIPFIKQEHELKRITLILRSELKCVVDPQVYHIKWHFER